MRLRLTNSILSLVVAVVFAVPAFAASSSGTVSSTAVRIELASPVPSPVLARIKGAAETVASRALEGKTIEEAEAVKASLAQAMEMIFNETLSGFGVESLEIDIAEKTVVRMRLLPSQPAIKRVKFEIRRPAGLAPYWNDFFENRLDMARGEILSLISGVPVSSARWSTEIVTSIVSGWLEDKNRFPGFAFTPSVTIGELTLITLDIRTSSDTISFVFVKPRSTTMPSLLLDRLKFDLASHSEFIVGLPIVFAERYEREIIDYFFNYLATNSQTDKFGLRYDIKPTFGKNTVIKTLAESEKYSAFARAKVSVDREQKNPDIEGHFGFFAGPKTEFFLESNFLPGPLDIQMSAGAGRRFGNFYAAGGWNFVDDLGRVWLDWFITEDIIISYEKNVSEIRDERNEGSVKFKAHDYFSFDVVTDFNTKVWLRIVANL
jgi:hypothetical protein